MKIVAINAGPRKGWNTDLMIKEAVKGALSASGGRAEIKEYDLYRLPKFTGCVSCFACKKSGSFGHCRVKDGLGPVLADIDSRDALIIGAPNYLGEPTAVFRALYERLMFRRLTYNLEKPSATERKIPVVFIMTSNAPRRAYRKGGFYRDMIKRYTSNFENFVGPVTLVIAGDTMQVDDYSEYDWTMFDPRAKKRSRLEKFPLDLENAFRRGEGLIAK